MNNSYINQRNFILLVLNSCYLLALFCWSIVRWNDASVISLYKDQLAVWICLQICCFLINIKIKHVSYYDFGVWYIGLSYLFMFGHIFMYIFDLKSTLSWNPILYYSNENLFHSCIFVLFTISAFNLSYFISYNTENILRAIKLNVDVRDVVLYKIGIVLCIIAGFSRVFCDIQIILLAQKANTYAALYAEGLSLLIFDDLALMLVPGILCLCFCGVLSKRKIKTLLIIACLYFALTMMLTGSRKIQIFAMLTIFLAYNCQNNRQASLKVKICYFLIIYILVSLLISIRSGRFVMDSILSIFMTKLLSLDTFRLALGEILAETSITLLSVTSIIEVVPDIFPFQYGMTFLKALFSVLPIGWLSGDFFLKAYSTYVINTYTKIPAGSSFIGSLYWNWGYVGGTIVAFICGICVPQILYKLRGSIRKSCVIYFSLFAQMIMLVRCELIDIFRYLIMLFVFMFVVECFFKRRG